MGLLESIKEDEKALEEAKKQEGSDDAEKPVEEVPAAEPEKAEAEPKPEGAVEEEPKPKTNAEAARERREKKARETALAEQLAEANRRIAELTQPREQAKTDTDPEPDKAEDPQAWNEWKIRKQGEELAEVRGYVQEDAAAKKQANTRNAAFQKINSYEQEVVKDNPDYPAAKQYYATMLATAIKMQHPSVTNEQLSVAVENSMLRRAGDFLQQDPYCNPVEKMLEESRSWGFKVQEQAEEKEVKPDLGKVAANKARNSGMAGAAGRGGSTEITPSSMMEMTNAEFAKLSPAQRKQAMDRLRA